MTVKTTDQNLSYLDSVILCDHMGFLFVLKMFKTETGCKWRGVTFFCKYKFLDGENIHEYAWNIWFHFTVIMKMVFLNKGGKIF